MIRPAGRGRHLFEVPLLQPDCAALSHGPEPAVELVGGPISEDCKRPLFLPRMIRAAVGGGGWTD